MENVTFGELERIKNHFIQINSAIKLGSNWFGSSSRMNSHIAHHKGEIFSILEKYNIDSVTLEKIETCLKSFDENGNKRKLSDEIFSESKLNEKDDNYKTVIDITNLDKREVIKALFSAATPRNLLDFLIEEIPEDLLNVLCQNKHVDYIGSRSIKVDLTGNNFDCRLYDRDNGKGSAQRALSKLRN